MIVSNKGSNRSVDFSESFHSFIQAYAYSNAYSTIGKRYEYLVEIVQALYDEEKDKGHIVCNM